MTSAIGLILHLGKLVVKWCGIDYGQTIMDPETLHQSIVISEVYVELGRPNEGHARLRKYYELRDRLGGTEVPPPQRVRLLKEYHRPELYRVVFDGDLRAIELYERKEAEALSLTEGLTDALEYLKGTGIALTVVSEATSVDTVEGIKRFLELHKLDVYFEELITPAGAFKRDGNVDLSFQGLTKKDGRIYYRLVEVLASRGIRPNESLMVGDDPQTDISHAKGRGMNAIQYTGVIDRGTSKADYIIRSWREIRDLI